MDPTSRFSHTVENYILYRPDYPQALLNFMVKDLGLEKDSVIADIGSGTGKLTKLILDNGNLVYGIEPNRAMREAAEQLLEEYDNFVSVPSAAEQTSLEQESVDWIIAGQAFHWFDQERFQQECQRILAKESYVIIVFNNRNDTKNEFMTAYESFLKTHSTDYSVIDHRRVQSENLTSFFSDKVGEQYFDHFQTLDSKGLKGRYLSCSYAMKEEGAAYQEAMTALENLFNQYQKNGEVKLWYTTEVFFGKIH